MFTKEQSAEYLVDSEARFSEAELAAWENEARRAARREKITGYIAQFIYYNILGYLLWGFWEWLWGLF